MQQVEGVRLSVEELGSGTYLGKFAFGGRTIPLRTLGPQHGDPNVMGVCTTVQYSLQWCTLTRPPLRLRLRN